MARVNRSAGDRLRPERRLGQHFLADPRLAEWLVDRFDPRATDRVVEIGPGAGALTRALATRAGRLLALEIDPRCVERTAAVLGDLAAAEVRLADALQVDWAEIARELGGPLRVIGNLPYNVGGAIVRRLLAAEGVVDVQVVLQLEVAQRLLATPGGKTYSPLTVIAALRARREKLRILRPGAFRPMPRVTSCCLRLTILPDAPLAAARVRWLERWLFEGFARRRKTLAGAFPARRDEVREFLAAHGLPRDARAETVPPAIWLTLAHELDRPPRRTEGR